MVFTGLGEQVEAITSQVSELCLGISLVGLAADE